MQEVLPQAPVEEVAAHEACPGEGGVRGREPLQMRTHAGLVLEERHELLRARAVRVAAPVVGRDETPHADGCGRGRDAQVLCGIAERDADYDGVLALERGLKAREGELVVDCLEVGFCG